MAYTLNEDKTGWKICKISDSGDYVLTELLIPAGTIIYQPDITKNPVCGKVITIEFWRKNERAIDVKRASSFKASLVIYERGCVTLACESYQKNPYFDGLHFFWTREQIAQEAARYGLPTHII